MLQTLRQTLRRSVKKGFTLAELLISLAIIGVIATYAIPKIMTTSQNEQNIAKVKEVAGMLTGALQQAQAAGTLSGTTKARDLTQYMNYVATDTSSIIDSIPAYSKDTCTSTDFCLVLHNGGALWVRNYNFNGSTNLNALEFLFDPDMKNNTTSTANIPGKAVKFYLYYDGSIRTMGTIKSNSCNSQACPFNANPSLDPSWFSW